MITSFLITKGMLLVLVGRIDVYRLHDSLSTLHHVDSIANTHLPVFSAFSFTTMVALAHLLTTFTCLSSLSVTLATYIPPQKRAPNGTCCGYYVENRDGFFRNRHEINFDQLASMDAVFTAGWEVSHGWQAGGINELTGQIPMADEKNVDLVRGQGLRLRVPRTFHVSSALLSLLPRLPCSFAVPRARQERQNHLRRRDNLSRRSPRRSHRNHGKVDEYRWNLYGHVYDTRRSMGQALGLERRARCGDSGRKSIPGERIPAVRDSDVQLGSKVRVFRKIFPRNASDTLAGAAQRPKASSPSLQASIRAPPSTPTPLPGSRPPPIRIRRD